MKTKKNSIQLSAVAITPNTIPNTPDVISKDNGVTHFGVNNLLHYYLADAIAKSPTHASIVDFKQTAIKGNGISETAQDVLSDKIINNAIKQSAKDLSTFETFTWLIQVNALKQITNIRPLPNEGVRVGALDKYGEPKNFYFSYNWSNRGEVTEYKAFKSTRKSYGNYILQKRVERPNQYYYTVPLWYSAIRWILLEDSISSFHQNNIDNGFFPSVIIELFGDEPTQESKNEFESKLNGTFAGTNGKKIITIFNEDGQESKTNITTFQPPDLPNYFDGLMGEISAKIMTAHKINPILVGIKEKGTTGMGSNSKEIESAYMLYLHMSIKPYQQLITEALEEIFEFNGTNDKAVFNSYVPSFDSVTDKDREPRTKIKDNE